MKVQLIALKTIGRVKAGDRLSVTPQEASVLIALKKAIPAPPPSIERQREPQRAKREYKRRDMVAEHTVPVVVAPAPSDFDERQ